MLVRSVLAILVGTLSASSFAGEPKGYDPAPLLAAQREAMSSLSKLDGTWRGSATMMLPGGQTRELTQTERVGSFLDGSIKVIEGRGYDAEGKLAFNAFAVVSFDPTKKTYNFRSYAQGHSGDFVFTPTPDGFTWDIPAGPTTMRYTATIKDGTWSEIGERLVPGQPPVRFIELTLKRVGDTDWPAGGAIAAK